MIDFAQRNADLRNEVNKLYRLLVTLSWFFVLHSAFQCFPVSAIVAVARDSSQTAVGPTCSHPEIGERSRRDFSIASSQPAAAVPKSGIHFSALGGLFFRLSEELAQQGDEGWSSKWSQLLTSCAAASDVPKAARDLLGIQTQQKTQLSQSAPAAVPRGASAEKEHFAALAQSVKSAKFQDTAQRLLLDCLLVRLTDSATQLNNTLFMTKGDNLDKGTSLLTFEFVAGWRGRKVLGFLDSRSES